jgi:hypothetical protein
VFAEFCSAYQIDLLRLLKECLTTEVDIDNLVKGSGLISDMDAIFGEIEWIPMQDGASGHRCETILSVVRPLVKILEAWPSSTPDLNRIQNSSAITQRWVGALNQQAIPQLTQIIREV